MRYLTETFRNAQTFEYTIRMLHDLESNVDQTDSKLNSALKKMQKFIRDTEGKYPLLLSKVIVYANVSSFQRQNLDGVLVF